MGKLIKKALLYAGGWLLIVLAFITLVILVTPWLVAALAVELVEEGLKRGG